VAFGLIYDIGGFTNQGVQKRTSMQSDGGFSRQTHELTHEKVTNNLFMGYTMLAN
jgi:hypothetical protein